MRWLAMIFYLLMLVMAFAALEELNPPGGALTIWMLIAVLSFLSVLVHEIGHALAAIHIGARLIVLVALPFELRFRPMRLGLARRRKHRDLGGYVLHVPPPGQTRRQAILVSACGPLANFALVAAALLLGAVGAAWFGASGAQAAGGSSGGLLPGDAELLASMGHAPSLRLAEASQLIADALAVISAGMGVANLIPYGGSDGATMLRAWKSPRPA